MPLDPEFKSYFNANCLPSGIFSRSDRPLPAGVKLINDPGLCMGLFSKYHEIPQSFVDEPFAKIVSRRGDTIFGDILGKFCKKVKIRVGGENSNKLSSAQQEDRKFLTSLNTDAMAFGDSFKNNIPRTSGISGLRGEVAGFLYYLIVYVKMAREEHLFAELSLACFAAGGIPCGWDGDYPDGNIICYWPHNEEPTFEDNPDYPWHAYMRGEDQ